VDDRLASAISRGEWFVDDSPWDIAHAAFFWSAEVQAPAVPQIYSVGVVKLAAVLTADDQVANQQDGVIAVLAGRQGP
jgi:hypothetical protein